MKEGVMEKEEGATLDGVLEERRRHPRRLVAWSIRLWLNEQVSLTGCTVDAGAHGAWAYFRSFPADAVKLGGRYRLEMHPGTRAALPCAAVVRHVNPYGVGLEITEGVPLPVAAA